jgi:CheY-like chemotaxis protein
MDHMMPEMDGIEAVKIIRNQIEKEDLKTVPIIALTANALLGNEKMFLENGFQDFLPKPINTARLDEILHKWVVGKN